MRKMQKTKHGMASIYVVVFVTMLIGVITLSFLRIMLSESGRTEKSTLADSAMNSAMAGVEDAKTLLVAYDNCINGLISDKARCGEVMTKVNSTADNSCDLGVYSSDNETNVGYGGANNSGSISDQAYTCVNLTVKGDFVGRIDDSEPVLVVPMRVEGGDVNSVAGVNISWTGSNSDSYDDYGDFSNSSLEKKDVASVLGKKGVTTTNSGNASKANGLKVTLIQTSSSYNNDDFYVSDVANEQTNRATVMLLPSSASDAISNVTKENLLRSADKTYNAPLSVKCTGDNYCATDVTFPMPKGGDRFQDTFFLVISRVYSEPTVDEVTIKMHDVDGNEIPFFNVQPIVDSTGRAGDLVRRVEVRLGSNAGQFVPLAELTVDGGLDKDFFVTKNCIKGTGSCEK